MRVCIAPILRRRVLCVAANHGMIDLVIHPSRIWVYAALLTPIPDIVWWIAFVPASVIHFGQDVGMFGSVLLHMFLAACAVHVDVEFAETCLLVFMVVVHIPCVLMRLNSRASVIFMFALIVAGLLGWSLVDPAHMISVTNAKVVTLHCLLGM